MDALIPREVGCPCCGERIEVLLDPSVAEQNYIEDCPVCCRPIVFDLRIDEERVDLRVFSENETA